MSVQTPEPAWMRELPALTPEQVKDSEEEMTRTWLRTDERIDHLLTEGAARQVRTTDEER